MATSSQEEVYNSRYEEWGLQQLEKVSRTFALSLQQLPEPVQTYASTAYLLCRIPDTIEDTQRLGPDTKQALLHEYTQVLQGSQTPEEFEDDVTKLLNETNIPDTPDWNLARETTNAFHLFHSFPEEIQNAIRPWVIELTQGMEEFVTRYRQTGGVRILSHLELEEYCYYVAGTVGHLLTDLLATHYGEPAPEEIHTAAEEYGLVLQFVNISKDVYEDYIEENNIYLPLNELAELGVTSDTLLTPENNAQVGESILDIASNAEHYSDSAHEFLEWLTTITPDHDEPQVFASMALPYLLAIATLREVKKHPEKAVTEQEVKISRSEVLAITTEVTGTNRPTLDTVITNIQNGEYTE